MEVMEMMGCRGGVGCESVRRKEEVLVAVLAFSLVLTLALKPVAEAGNKAPSQSRSRLIGE